MKLIGNWRKAHRFGSVRIAAVGALLGGIGALLSGIGDIAPWLHIATQWINSIPRWVLFLGGAAFCVTFIIARVLMQRKLHERDYRARVK